MAHLLVTCCYCNEIMGVEDITHEHLIPRSWGGVKTILVCRPCNMKRGTSFRYVPFLKFIRANTDLYRAHVEHSKTAPHQRHFLMSLLEYELPEENREPVDWHQLLCKEMLEKMRTSEAKRQIHALTMAKNGTPVDGGRASRASKRRGRKKKIRGKFRNIIRERLDENFVD